MLFPADLTVVAGAAGAGREAGPGPGITADQTRAEYRWHAGARTGAYCRINLLALLVYAN